MQCPLLCSHYVYDAGNIFHISDMRGASVATVRACRARMSAAVIALWTRAQPALCRPFRRRADSNTRNSITLAHTQHTHTRDTHAPHSLCHTDSIYLLSFVITQRC